MPYAARPSKYAAEMAISVAVQGQEKTGQKCPLPSKGYQEAQRYIHFADDVDYYGDGRVTVIYITAHTNHQPGSCEDA